MFRGKESSNRIELSRLVQDLLNFGVLGCKKGVKIYSPEHDFFVFVLVDRF